MAPERKQVKKFLKPKVEGGEESPVESSRKSYVLALGTVAIVVAAVWFAPSQFRSSSTSDVSKGHVGKDNIVLKPTDTVTAAVVDRRVPDPVPAKKANVIPTYDEYIKQAEINNWHPTDPVLKLESSILKHTQLFDIKDLMNDASKLKQYIDMMSQEIRYVIAVLGGATDRTIDLTQALHKAIDIIPELTYRSLKWQLSLGRTRVTTRAQMTQNLQHWVYGPLRELITLMATKPAHIVMDVNDPGVGGAALVRVVKHRLYGLISVFLSVESTPHNVFEALRIAVHQADDLGVALILNTLTGTNAASVPNHAQLVQEIGARLPELIDIAQKLHFTHIAGRIRGIAARLAGDVSAVSAAAGEVPADKVDIFNEYCPYQHVPVAKSDAERIEVGAVDPLTGYSAFQIDHIYTAAANGVDGYADHCAIDRIDIADLSTDRFYSEYVSLNRPVVITHSAGGSQENVGEGVSTADQPVVGRVWALESLLKRFGSTQEVSSVIPYATLFGHKEEVVTLNNFVTHPTSGMQAYTRRLQQTLGEQGNTLSDQQLLEVAATVGLPQYIFSGVQQSMGRAMRKHMLKSVKQYAATGSALGDSAHLLELMYAVSRGYNGSEPRTPHSDFKSSWRSQFYLGPALSGAPFHHHGPAFNVLVHGRKEWTIMPPGRDLYSSMHPLEWLREVEAAPTVNPYHSDKPPAAEATATLRTDKACKLVQTPGDVLFVPRHWTHQILNLAESVGFAVEIDDYVV